MVDDHVLLEHRLLCLLLKHLTVKKVPPLFRKCVLAPQRLADFEAALCSSILTNLVLIADIVMNAIHFNSTHSSCSLSL